MLVMVLVFGMTVIGCDNGTTGGSDPGNGNGTGGYLTIKDIPDKFDGQFARFIGGDGTGNLFLEGATSLTFEPFTKVLPQISSGSVTLPIWDWRPWDSGYVRFYGNATVSGQILIYGVQAWDNSLTRIAIADWGIITFSGGSATLTWASADHHW